MKAFDIIFSKDETYHDQKYNSTIVVGRHVIGKINLPTGRVIFSDPWLLDDPVSIGQQLEPGLYDVTSITEDHEYGSETKLVLISRNGQVPVRWESYHGFSVDSASACFVDEKYANILLKEWKQKNSTDAKSHFDQQVLNKSFEENRNFAVHHFENDTTPGLYAFRTNDGGYPVFYGVDENDKVICFLVDFHSSFFDDLVPGWPADFHKPPQTYGLDFVEWILSISDELKRNPLDKDSIDFIESTAHQKIPADLNLYYQLISPWGDSEDPRSQWEEIVNTHWLTKNTPIFPVDLKYKIVCEQIDNDRYIIKDLEMHTWGRDLRKYYLTNYIKIFGIDF